MSDIILWVCHALQIQLLMPILHCLLIVLLSSILLGTCYGNQQCIENFCYLVGICLYTPHPMILLGCHDVWFFPWAVFAEIQDMHCNFYIPFNIIVNIYPIDDSQVNNFVFSVPMGSIWS